METTKFGCAIGVGVFVLAALCSIIFLALLGPTIGNVFSNVIDGLEESSIITGRTIATIVSVAIL